MSKGTMKVGHEADVVPGITRALSENPEIDLTSSADPCESHSYKKVRFVDDPNDPRGRGRLDLATGERIR